MADDPSALDEECLALEAIFEERFARLDSNRVRIIVEPTVDAGAPASVPLFLEMALPTGYPSEPPTFDLSNPNNAAFLADVKQDILSGLRDQAAAAAGEAMMFNLAVWAQENLGGFIARSLAREKAKQHGGQASASAGGGDAAGPAGDDADAAQLASYNDVTKHMSKKQKKKFFDCYGMNEEKPRGWDWVDVIWHLGRK